MSTHITWYLFEMCLEWRVLLSLQATKQFARVAWLVIVGTQHLCRHRLAEAAASCHAAVSALRVERRIDQRYQRCLVNILMSDDVAELTIASIDICTHGFKSVAGVISPQSRCKDTTLFPTLQMLHGRNLILAINWLKSHSLSAKRLGWDMIIVFCHKKRLVQFLCWNKNHPDYYESNPGGIISLCQV